MKSKQSGGASSPGNDQGMAETTIITRVLASVQQLDPQTWNALLALQPAPTPFMRHEYLAAMEQSGSATPETGWVIRVITIWDQGELLAACPLYIKNHSYGEYVFDWAWARAYEQHGLPYYPKAVMAVPFTPVPGSRLLARTQALRLAPAGMVQTLPNDTVRALLQAAAAAGTSIMCFVGNLGMIQIHTGPVHRVELMGPWINVLDPGFSLHLREDLVTQTWLVRKPTTDGIVTSVELFDAQGETIAMFFGERKPGKPEIEAWRELLAMLPGMAA